MVKEGRKMKNFLIFLMAIISTFMFANPYAESQEPKPPDFKMPIQSTGEIFLITEVGGKSSIYTKEEGYRDSFHNPDKAYYAIDLDVSKGSKGTAVASESGKVVAVIYEGKYPHITIDHGNGYFTEYAEFDINKKFKAGDKVGRGDTLGTLSGKPQEHLHFQVKYSETGTFGQGLSKQDNKGLKGVAIEGIPMTDFKLKTDKNGMPQSTSINAIAHQTVPVKPAPSDKPSLSAQTTAQTKAEKSTVPADEARIRNNIQVRMQMLNEPPPPNLILEPATGIKEQAAKSLALGFMGKEGIERYNQHYNASLDYNMRAKEALGYVSKFLNQGDVQTAEKYLKMSNDFTVLMNLEKNAALETFRRDLGRVNDIEHKIAKAGMQVANLSLKTASIMSGKPELIKSISTLSLIINAAVDNTFAGKEAAVKNVITSTITDKLVETVLPPGASNLDIYKIPMTEIKKTVGAFVGKELAKLGIKESGMVESFLNNFVKELQTSKVEIIPSAAAKQEQPQEKPKAQSDAKANDQTEKTVAAKPATESKDSSSEKPATTKPSSSDKPKSSAQAQPKAEKKEPATAAPPSTSEKPKVTVIPTPASPRTDKTDGPKISDIQKGTINGGSASKTQQTLDKAGQTIAQVEGTLKQMPQSIKTQSASQKQETQQTLSELKQKLIQLQETLKQLQNESIKKQAVSNILPIATNEPIKVIKISELLPYQGKVPDASKLKEGTPHENVTPVKVEFTQTFDGLFTQSANSLGSIYGTHSGTLTDGTRVNSIGDSRPGAFTGSFSGQSVAETGYTPATHNNSAFSGSSVGKVSAMGLKEGDLKGTMTVTVPAGTQTIQVTGDIKIKTDGSLTMPSYTGPVTDNATGTKVGTMSGSWSQSKTR